MERPRILLVPGFSELVWTIKPELEEWAEVASYDPPGVGGEPALEPTHRAVADRGLKEVDARSWRDFLIAVDGFMAPTAVEIATQRGERVLGLAIGHAALSQRRTGERAPINGEVWSALTQLLGQDHAAFVRYAIVQSTRGSFDEDLAQAMIDRTTPELIESGWRALTAEEDFAEQLKELNLPLLLAQHEGCLLHTNEGYEDAVAAFPSARTVTTPEACCTSPAFAGALRDFAEELAPT